MEMSEEEILHYGVKGMKWGVRNGVSAVRTAVAKVPAPVRKAAKIGAAAGVSMAAIDLGVVSDGAKFINDALGNPITTTTTVRTVTGDPGVPIESAYANWLDK